MSNFPTMGTSAAHANNVSAAPSANTKLVPKKMAAGGSPEPDTAVARTHTMERNGFKGAPQMNHVYAQAPEAGLTYRNVRLVKSSIGNRDFYDRRAYGQGM